MLHTATFFFKKRKPATTKEANKPVEQLPDNEQSGLLLRRLGRLADAVVRSEAGDKNREEEEIRETLKQIAVIAFIGSSGTGKSTHAIRVARKHQISYLIDDGLLIHGSKVLAGSSAKRAATKIESVRQALFADQTRAEVIRRALVAHRPSTLMILGTSDGMLTRICDNLWLNQPSMLIRIEDVSSEEEMRKAKAIRLSQGRHTIPVPSIEIKHEFSGTFVDSFLRLKRKKEKGQAVTDSERTVVRPTFSRLGQYSMSDEAMRMMIENILLAVPGVAAMTDFFVRNEAYGVVIFLSLVLYYGYNAPEVLNEAQRVISQKVEAYTSVNVMAVNVKAGRVVKQNN